MVWAIITLTMLGRLCISAAWQVLYVWSLELFPTSVRVFMVQATMLSGRIGSTIGPLIKDLVSSNLLYACSQFFLQQMPLILSRVAQISTEIYIIMISSVFVEKDYNKRSYKRGDDCPVSVWIAAACSWTSSFISTWDKQQTTPSNHRTSYSHPQ